MGVAFRVVDKIPQDPNQRVGVAINQHILRVHDPFKTRRLGPPRQFAAHQVANIDRLKTQPFTLVTAGKQEQVHDQPFHAIAIHRQLIHHRGPFGIITPDQRRFELVTQ